MARADNDFQNFVNESKAQRASGSQAHSNRTVSTNGQGATLGEDNANVQIQQLREQLEAEKQRANLANAKLKESQDDKARLQQHIDSKEGAVNEKAVNDVIEGFSKTFKKQYKFDVDGAEPEVIDIELKPLSAIGISQLQQRVTQFTNAQGKYFDDEYKEISEAVNVFQVAAVKCPDWLKDPSQIYRLDIPIQIYQDYLEWLQSFRKSNKH